MEPTQSADRVISPKAALRRDVLARLEPPSAADATALAGLLLALPEVRAATCVAAFVSMGKEPGTRPFLDDLLGRGIPVLLPVLLPDGDLGWAVYRGWDALADGAAGTLEPRDRRERRDRWERRLDEADVVVVPAVAVDVGGGRLGRGGGSYDRALRTAMPGALVVAAVADPAVVAAVPVEEHDQRVHVVVTPTRLIRCSSTRGQRYD